MLCPYCGDEKPDTEATDEHVIPKALGGNLTPTNPFLLKTVCQKCNSASGRWIDGLFIRSWFTQNQRAENAIRYFDLNANPVLPLSYLGPLQEGLLTNKVCDVWLGPTGDVIYHFHAPYPETPDSFGIIGRPLHLPNNKVDAGFVFLFVRATNPVWHKPILSSVIEHFKNSTLYLGNDPTYVVSPFSNIPHELNELHNHLRGNIQKKHNIKMTASIFFGDRFLAKLALGLGALFLDYRFIKSVDAQSLREFMWEKSSQERGVIPIPRVPFLSGTLRLWTQSFLSWEAGHILLLLPLDNKLFLVPILYGNLIAEIVICSDPNLWNGRIDKDGLVYIVAPGLRRYVGPVSLPHYIAVRTNTIEDSNELGELFRQVDLLGELPPYDLPQSVS